MGKPPWAKDTQKNKKEHGSFADFVAWENWIKGLDEYDILEDIEMCDRGHLYSMFCECFPNYSWK